MHLQELYHAMPFNEDNMCRFIIAGQVGVASYELNKNELPSGPAGGWTEERRDALLRTFVRNTYTYHNNEIFAVLRNEYTDWELSGGRAGLSVKHHLYESLSDGLVVASLTEVLRLHVGLRRGRTFMYHLNHPGLPQQQQLQQQQQQQQQQVRETGDGELHGSFHNDDVFYLLGLPLVRGGTQEEIDVSEQLIAYVAGFCYAG